MAGRTVLTALAAAALLGLVSCSSEPKSDSPSTVSDQQSGQSTTQNQTTSSDTQSTMAQADPQVSTTPESLTTSANGHEAQVAAESSEPAATEVPEGLKFAAYDTYGKLRESTEWFGQKPVVVNFWGTWCPPCRREIPDLVKLYQEYSPKGVEILGVALRDEPQKVEQFAANNNMRWPMLMGTLDIAYQFGATQGVPTTIFYDKNGKELMRVVGAQSYEQFKPLFESIL